MAISRPLLIALVGAVLVAAAFLVMRAAGGDEPSAPQPSATPASESSAAPAAPEGDTTEPAAAERGAPSERAEPSARGLPHKVERALDRGKVVVVTLFDRGGADDILTGRGLLSASRHPGVGPDRAERVRVYPDFLSNVSRYVGITQALQVTRAPAAIVIDEQRRARVLQGYTDASSLRQHVVDALG